MFDPLGRPPHRVYDHIRTRAIVVHQGRLLLVPPAAGDRAWFPPGGGLEPGEGLTQALAREVLEETGIPVRVGRLAFLLEWVALPGRAPGQDYDLHLFYYAEPTGTLTPRPERDGLPAPEWVPLRRVPALPLRPAELKHLALALADGHAPAHPRTLRARLEDPGEPPPWPT